MQVWLICSEAQEQELGALPGNLIVSRNLDAPPPQLNGVIDLLFEENAGNHLGLLSELTVPVIVASLLTTSKQLPQGFTRVNAWPGFLQGPLVEACGSSDQPRALAIQMLGLLGKQPEWVPDIPGMISARVIAGIINEAYLAFAEGVASRADIDTAMKLGTNYPFGPFEWAEKIGRYRLASLLHALAAADSRYVPCTLLAGS